MGVREAIVPGMVAEIFDGDAGLGGKFGKPERRLDEPGTHVGIACWGGLGISGEEIEPPDELLGLGFWEIGTGRETKIVWKG